jgi:hypothetical protein
VTLEGAGLDDYTVGLLERGDVADGTMAFRFETFGVSEDDIKPEEFAGY